MALRTRNAVLLAKIESSELTDASPSAGSDAVKVEVDMPSFQQAMAQTNEVSGSLDRSAPVPAGTTVTIPFTVVLKGSGTAGTAPEVGKLLKACGMSETVTGAAVPAAPEACANGGSTTTAVLGASASSTAQAYRGMPVTFSSTVSGTSFISDYTAGKVATLTDTMGGAIVNTSNYQVVKNVLYGPASGSIPTLTMYLYMDGVVYKFVGCRGNLDVSLPTNDVGRLRFEFRGVFSAMADASVPVPSYDEPTVYAIKGGYALYDRATQATRSISLGLGNTITFPDNPNNAEGVDAPIITDRQVRGSLDPLATVVATRDPLTTLRAGTEKILHVRYGSAAGNRLAITVPKAQILEYNPTDDGGLKRIGTPFQGNGADASAFLCFW
jgi:hypothetical protein